MDSFSPRTFLVITAINSMAAAQAFDLRAPVQPSPATQAVYDVIRQHVTKLVEDRPLHSDINCLTKMAKAGEILAAAEGVVGKLS